MLSASKLQSIVCSARMAEAEHFYSTILGLPLKGRSLGALVYEVGGSDLRVSPVPSIRPSEHTAIGFAVADLSTDMSTLEERGVQWERFPGFHHDERGVLQAPDGSRVVWLRDPNPCYRRDRAFRGLTVVYGWH